MNDIILNAGPYSQNANWKEREYSYMHALPNEFLLKSTVKTINLKRNLLRKTCIHMNIQLNYRSSYRPALMTQFLVAAVLNL